MSRAEILLDAESSEAIRRMVDKFFQDIAANAHNHVWKTPLPLRSKYYNARVKRAVAKHRRKHA